jgi:hypothetical protein
MPLWAWILVAITALLVPRWTNDRRARRRGACVNGPWDMARGVSAAQANPDAHRGALTADRSLPPAGGPV